MLIFFGPPLKSDKNNLLVIFCLMLDFIWGEHFEIHVSAVFGFELIFIRYFMDLESEKHSLLLI